MCSINSYNCHVYWKLWAKHVKSYGNSFFYFDCPQFFSIQFDRSLFFFPFSFINFFRDLISILFEIASGNAQYTCMCLSLLVETKGNMNQNVSHQSKRESVSIFPCLTPLIYVTTVHRVWKISSMKCYLLTNIIDSEKSSVFNTDD